MVEHSLTPPSELPPPGAMQRPSLQTVPRSQSVELWQVFTHPPLVHSEPLEQLALPVQGGVAGAGTLLHP